MRSDAPLHLNISKPMHIPESPGKEVKSDGGNSLWEPEERQWAEVVDFIPGWRRNHRKNGEAFRYIAIRIRSRQRDLFEADNQRWRYFAVVTNMAWDGERLLRWQRDKQVSCQRIFDSPPTPFLTPQLILGGREVSEPP